MQSNELYHHGILGQKWGVQNGPPYPIGSGEHSKSEVKAGWKASLKKKSKENNSDGLKKTTAHIKSNDSRRQISDKELSDYRNEMVSRYSGNSEKQQFYKTASKKELKDDIERKQQTKKVLLTVAAAAGIGVGLYAAYRFSAMSDFQAAYAAGKVDKSQVQQLVANAMQTAADDIDEILSAGSSIHRMEAYKDLDITKIDKIAYAAYKDIDVQAYKGVLKDWAGTGERYHTVYDVTKDIKIPNKDAVEKAFFDLWKNDPSYKKAVEESYVRRVMHVYRKARPTLSDKQLKALAEGSYKHAIGAFGEGPFDTAMYAMVDKGNDSKIFADKLLSKGYGAIIDYFDAGKFTDRPLILLDPKGFLQKSGEHFVSGLEKRNAEIEWYKLKGLI